MKSKLSYVAIFATIIICFNLFINESNSRSVRFDYTIDLDKSNNKVEVWLPIPQTNEVQTVSNVSLSNKNLMQCKELIEQKHKNKYYYCSVNQLEKETTLTLSVEVTRQEHSTVNYENVNPDDYDKGTYNSTVFEGKVFDTIINEAKLSKDNVDDIYEYVLSGMHYGKPTDDINDKNYKYYDGKNPKTKQDWLPESFTYGRKQVSKKDLVTVYNEAKANKTNFTYGNGNSKYACDIGVGNCTDYHSYFMSLCRTLDIPARFHMGFSIPNKENESEGKVGGYHCWADYYTEGEGWTPVDISEADKDPSMSEYFNGTVNEHRIEFVVGRDIELINRDKPENFFVYPIVKGTGYSKSFYYKNL